MHRIVSLTCSNTEIVCALGCADRLVGIDDYSDHPAEALEGLPRVGPDLGIDVAAVTALRPDLVLASLTVPGHDRVVEDLEEAGLPWVAPAPESVADVLDDIRSIADLLGVADRGAELAEALARRLEPAAPPEPDRPSIAIQWWPRPSILAGNRSWAAELVTRAGGRNALAEDLASRPLTDGEMAALAPDAIVISWCGVATHKMRPDVVLENETWADVPAVRDRQVHVVSEAFLGRPGPRLGEGLDRLRQVVAACRRGIVSFPAGGAAPVPGGAA